MGDNPPDRVKVESCGTTATVTLNDPRRRNALGTREAGQLVDCFLRLDDDPNVRVIVLTGAGETFSAGGDLDEFLRSVEDTASDVWESGAPWGRLYGLFPQLSKPVIARVEGPAYAGGCGLVACCDFALAADSAKFALPEIKIGLFALFILPPLLERISKRDALDLALTGRSVSADYAAQIGLINRVVPSAELDTSIADLAAQLASTAPATMRRAKHAFRILSRAGHAEALELARGLRGAFMGSEELRQGIQAFKAQRP